MLFFHLTMSLSNGLLEGGVVCLLRLAFGEEGGSDSMTSSSSSSDADADAGCSTPRSSCTYKESPIEHIPVVFCRPRSHLIAAVAVVWQMGSRSLFGLSFAFSRVGHLFTT